MRLWLAIIVALGLAPGTFVRVDRQSNDDPRVYFQPLALPAPSRGPFRIEGAWAMSSENTDFGGYSALAAFDNGELLALSDRGRTLRFRPVASGATRPAFGSLLHHPSELMNHRDFEALARDPASETLWAVFEGKAGLSRIEANGNEHSWRVADMQGWDSNGGPEAMARLADGRFVILAEDSLEWGSSSSPGLLYPREPVEGVVPVRFNLSLEDGYRPTDMASLPDGQLLLLARKIEIAIPPRFPARLLVADPRAIREGGTWTPQVLATLEEPLPSDNFEGLALERAGDGRLVAWLISDDNHSVRQRTLLFKLSFNPDDFRPRPKVAP